MPKVGEILETALYVDDPERSAEFYRRVLRLERIVTSDRGIVLHVSGHQVLLLFKKGASTRPTVTPGGTVPPTDGSGELHVAFTITAADFDPWRDWLRQSAVPIESEVTWERGGRSLYFRDPDRHVIELATPGVWPVY